MHPKTVDGGGTFVHKNAAGGIVGAGDWRATDLISFKSYGPNVAEVPVALEAGKAIIGVELLVDGEPVATGILEIGCLLGGPQEPGGAFEGVRLNLLGPLNFNDDQLGITLFIRQ